MGPDAETRKRREASRVWYRMEKTGKASGRAC